MANDTGNLGFLSNNKKLFEGVAIGLGAAFLGVAVWNVFFKKATVLGAVTDRDTGLPLEGVLVSLAGDDGSFQTATTDAAGNYKFTEGATVSYSYQGYQYQYYYDITFELAGYTPMTRNQLVFHPQGNTYNVAMEAI
jgi:hypothetical protein